MATILVVDDETLLRQLIRDCLEAYRFEVIEACTGWEAFDQARRTLPDLILLDVMMPDLDGFQVCRMLKGDYSTQAIPVILLTARDGLGDRVKGLDAGASDYLTKPVQPGELLARVRAHLRSKHLYDELRRRQADFAKLLELSKAVASTLRAEEVFRLIVQRTAELVYAQRCSIVVIGGEDDGYVVVSNDDPSVRQLKISLDRYPEIREAVRLCQPVVVQDITEDPLMAEVREAILPLGFRSLLVIPITLRGSVIGTLVLRTVRFEEPFTEQEIQLCQIVAEIAATALQNAHLFESLELANINLERLTLIDDLTQIYNRRFLFRRLEEEFERARRYSLPLCCVMLDIDFFKQVNDRYGHAQGDSVLKEMASLIQGTIRRSDLFARYGGEEFVLLLPVTEGSGAIAEAERVRQAVRAHRFAGIEPMLLLTISQGIANYPLNQIRQAPDLLELADRALYQAKEAGRDAIRWAWPS